MTNRDLDRWAAVPTDTPQLPFILWSPLWMAWMARQEEVTRLKAIRKGEPWCRIDPLTGQPIW